MIDTKPWDAAEFLDTSEAQAEYLRLALEDPDPGRMVEALGTVARARGMSRVAEDAGLNRQALYRALRPEAKPTWDTVRRTLGALGFSVTITPAAGGPVSTPARPGPGN